MLRRRTRDGRGQVVVHVASAGDPGDVAVAVAADMRTLAGLLPHQFVAAAAGEPLPEDAPTLGRRLG